MTQSVATETIFHHTELVKYDHALFSLNIDPQEVAFFFLLETYGLIVLERSAFKKYLSLIHI